MPVALPRCAPILPLPTTSAPTTSSANAPAPGVLSRSNLQRKRKREAQILEHGYRTCPTALRAHVRPAVEVKTYLKVADLRETSCGYVAKNAALVGKRLAAVEALLDKGYDYIKNNGL